MDEIFSILASAGDGGDPADRVELGLPAAAYSLRDVVDRLCREGVEELSAGIYWCGEYGFLKRFLDDGYEHRGTRGLYELNALARRLSELDDFGIIAFNGLLKMESAETEGPIELPRMIDLAYSTDCCHVVDEALNDSQLGRFLAENGLVPETVGIPDGAFELLDFEQIGRRRRMAEGSVFVKRSFTSPGGYVERHDDIVEAYSELDLEPKAPDYTVLLNLEYGGKRAQLKLPAGERSLNAELEQLGALNWSGVSWRCADCAAPALAGSISEETDLTAINRLAQSLADMEPDALPLCKAVLETAECADLPSAEQLIGTLDEYRLSSQARSLIQCAKEKLAAMMPEEDAALLIPHLDLCGYGRSLFRERNAVMTSYGLVERKDGQPIQAMETRPEQGGMEMT